MHTFQPAISLLSMKYVDAIQHLASHPEIAATTRMPYPYPKNGARMFIEISEQERETGKSFHNVILNNNELVGICGLMNIKAGKYAELGYWIGRPYWGKGFASFGVHSMLGIAFNDLQLQMLYATVIEYNKASIRVLEKNGFTFKRKEPHNNAKWGLNVQLCIYEIIEEEWREHTQIPFPGK